MASQRGFSRGRLPTRGSRRQTGWEEGPGGDLAPELFTASSSVILGSGVAALSDGLTVVRLRGELQAYMTAVVAANDGYSCAVGACIVSNDAFAIGVTAVPTPIEDMDWNGWLYHRFFHVHSVSTAVTATDSSLVLRFEVDSKAMRKIAVNETLCMVMEVLERGTASLSVWFDSRILLKLP